MDPSDLMDLYGGDADLARARADVMARRAQGMQGAGLILHTLAGDRDPAGGALEQLGTADVNRVASAIADRPHYQTQQVAAQKAQDELDASHDPATADLYRKAIQTVMPSLGVDETTPTPALRGILPIAERFGQAGLMAQFRAATQGKIKRNRDYDANTGKYRITYTRPLDGATWDENFKLISPGIPGMGLPQTLSGMETFEDAGGGQGPPPSGPKRPALSSIPQPAQAGPGETPPGGAPAPTRRPILTRNPPAVPADPDTAGSAVPSGNGGSQPASAPAPGQSTLSATGGGHLSPMIGKPLDKALKDLGADFDPNGGRAGELGKNQARINAANRLLQLAVDENGQAKNLTPNQMPELAQSLASLISGGGSGAQAQIEHLTPSSLRGDMAKTMQWLFNEPTGADQQAFVKNMVDTAKRERDVATSAVQQAAAQRIGKHQVLISRNPQEAARLLQGYGYDLDPRTLAVRPRSAVPATGIAPAPASGKVRVRYQGRELEIPQSRLADAQKDGAEVIQ